MHSENKSEVRGPRSSVEGKRQSTHRRGLQTAVFGLRTSDFGLRAILLLAFLFAVLPARAGDARKPTVESLGNQVMCVCGGCVAPLNQCPMLDCAEKAEMRAFISKEIAEGKDEPTILQDVASRYGVKALAAPPAKGFNLVVWILPGIGLMVGLGLVVAIVRRWQMRQIGVPAPTPESQDPKVLAAMEEEMKAAGLR